MIVAIDTPPTDEAVVAVRNVTGLAFSTDRWFEGIEGLFDPFLRKLEQHEIDDEHEYVKRSRDPHIHDIDVDENVRG